MTDLLKDHSGYWLQYIDSGIGTLPATPYLVSLGIAVIVALLLIWIAWRIVSWPFRKRSTSKKTALSANTENALSLPLPEGYENWPKTIQDSYLKAEMFLLDQSRQKNKGAIEAVQGLNQKDSSKALHFLGSIRDEAQRKQDTRLQVNAMRFSSALAFPTNIDLAKQTIEAALSLTPNEPMVLLQNGDIALKQKEVKEAFQSYSQALKISRENNHHKGQVSALATLGALFLLQKDTIKAEDLLTESISITETMLQKETNDPSWLRLAAKNYITVGNIKQAQQKFPEARQNFDKGIAIKEKLANSKTSSLNLKRDIYLSYIQLGDMLRKQNEISAAQDYYQKAITTSHALIKQFPEQIILQRDQSIALNKLGQNDLQNKDTESALKHFQAALKIRQALLTKAPENTHFSRDVAISHERLGDFFSLGNDFSAARPHFLESKKIMEALLAKNDSNLLWQEDLARYLSRIAYIQTKSGENEQAISSLKQVINIKENLLKKIPDHSRVNISLANSYIMLAKLDKSLSRPTLEKSLALLNSLMAKNKLPQSNRDMIPYVEKQLASLG